MPEETPWVRLNSDELSADVDPLGAQLSALRDRDGRDLLWNGDPAFWTGRAPVLFPIVGELAGGAYRLGSRSYPLPRHGFARRRVFEIAESTRASALFRLRADAESLSVYPFHFDVDVRFSVVGSALSMTARVRNTGDVELPASFGWHPALRWPLPFGRARADHVIEFAHEEPAPIRRLDAHGLLTPTAVPTPIVGRRLALDDSLFTDDAVIFDRLQSRSVTYGCDGGRRLRVSFPDSPYLGIWSKPGAGFVCIEPWNGIADPEGYGGDFTAKPGVFVVAVGAAMQIDVTLTLLD